jgi:hypothetical protein
MAFGYATLSIRTDASPRCDEPLSATQNTRLRTWREGLGVTRTDNGGSLRLTRAAAEAGAKAMKAREWTDEERERRRRVNAERRLAANLITGYHGPLWAAEETALLGQVPDAEVAGRTVGAVRQKREEFGIPNPAGNRWRCDEIALLGTLPDCEVARRLGRSLQSVTQKRIKLGILNPFDGRRRTRS